MAQASTIVPSSTKAPMFTKLGISTTLRPMKAPWRTIDPGTARKPALWKSAAPQSPNLLGTLSQNGPSPAA